MNQTSRRRFLAATGQVAVMHAEREVVVTDKALVATLTRHLRA